MQTPLRLRLAVLGTAIVASACGSSSPLSPSAVGTITGITLAVNPPPVGASVSAVATVSLSTGTSVAVLSGFTSDTPSVATVTSAGVITGVSVGDVTISIDYQGFKASKKVRVLPNYSGTLLGNYTLDSCTDTGGYVGATACAGLAGNFPVGSTQPIGFLSTQSADLTSLTGQFQFLQAFVGNGSGTIASAGGLTYTGSLVSGSTWRMDFQNFTATSTSVGHVNGHFEMVWTDTTQTGSSVWSCTIVDLVRQ